MFCNTLNECDAAFVILFIATCFETQSLGYFHLQTQCCAVKVKVSSQNQLQLSINSLWFKS